MEYHVIEMMTLSLDTCVDGSGVLCSLSLCWRAVDDVGGWLQPSPARFIAQCAGFRVIAEARLGRSWLT